MSKTQSSWQTETHELFDGGCKVLRTNQNGDVYQLHVWVKTEGKLYRKSLRTKHLETALEKGKEEYINIMSRVNSGKKIFSDDVATVAKRFLYWKNEDVKAGIIGKSRLGTIKTHIQHMLSYLNTDMKVGDIHTGTFLGYYTWRKSGNSSVKAKNSSVTEGTISGEYSTIRLFIKYCYREGFTDISADRIEIKKSDRSKLLTNVRRDTFTEEEWERLYTGMRSFCAKKNCENEIEYYEKQIFRNYILGLANTGMRTGELEQLQWRDIIDYRKTDDYGKTKEVVFLQVRAETSKVRKDRRLFCRDSACFRRTEEISINRDLDDLVFGDYKGRRLTSINKKIFWQQILDFTRIDISGRNITYYSLRHFYVTQRWKGGVKLRDIANSCGTSIHQLEKTYYHLDEETLMDTALKDERRGKKKKKAMLQ
ncbi:MAG: tyrosine-type recombinase/integrase [Pseudomonadales bacterium]|nr:tyrosine-type recombinase/integrase [Pseudomonadales bacterium]